MHVAQVNFVPAPPDLAPEALLARWNTLPDVADAVASAGTQVSVVQVAPYEYRMTRGAVDYHFVRVPVDDGGRRIGTLLGDIGAEVLHANGLAFAQATWAVSRHQPSIPVVCQDHADRPPPWWRRAQWRGWYSALSAVSFTAPELARPYLDAKLFPPSALRFAIAESSCLFQPGSQALARAQTRLHGDPCVLWVGHLVPGKDPLTMLEGVAQATSWLPDLHVWCAFGSAPLLDEMNRRIAADPRLAGRIHFMGTVAHERIERLMQAADIFVSASHREGSGYALLEALACGAAPVVTDIPSFRALTGNGRIGQLWPVGDAGRLAQALVAAAATPPTRQAVRDHFDAELSPLVLGQRWTSAYARVLATARGPKP